MDAPTRPLPHLFCPLCGGPNGCRPAASGSFGEPCWCTTARFDAATLARAKAAGGALACVCAACAKGEVPADAAPRARLDEVKAPGAPGQEAARPGQR